MAQRNHKDEDVFLDTSGGRKDTAAILANAKDCISLREFSQARVIADTVLRKERQHLPALKILAEVEIQESNFSRAIKK